MSTETVDFFQSGVEILKTLIKGVEDSYNHDWDIISELTQNAVDAIRSKKDSTDENKIFLSIDAYNKRIHIKDNGIGVPAETVKYLLQPFSTSKQNTFDNVGEKGVGLSFVIFKTQKFIFKTGQGDTVTTVLVEQARSWKENNNDDVLEMDIKTEKLDGQFFEGTEITLEGLEDLPIFNLTFEQLEYILRTKTSLGNTKVLWQDDIDIDITFEFISPQQKNKKTKIPFRYYLIEEDFSNKNEIVDLDAFKEKYSNAATTDREKHNALYGKILSYKKTFEHEPGKEIRAYAYAVPFKLWEDLSLHKKLISEENLKDEKWLSKYYYTMLRPGIYTAVKGMPTGVTITPPNTGQSGYWRNIFILFEYDYLSFDIGRKSIHGKQAELLRKYAKEIFYEITKYSRYNNSEKVLIKSNWERDPIFLEFNGKEEITSLKTKYKYVPESEAQIAGMFHELVGSKDIEGFEFVTSGYTYPYDLYCVFNNVNIVVDFKVKPSDILLDLKKTRKVLSEIDCLVCWEVCREDKKKFKKAGIAIEEIKDLETESFSLVPIKKKKFDKATYKMIIDGYEIEIIEIKEVIK